MFCADSSLIGVLGLIIGKMALLRDETFFLLEIGHIGYQNKSRILYWYNPNCTGSCEPGSRCHPNECIFGREKPRGVGNLELGSSVYKQSETKVDGSCHSEEGSK
jgi:hypothetical protein